MTQTITFTIREVLLFAAILLTLGWTSCDFFWTIVRSDTKATAHFGKANTRRLLSWSAVGLLTIIAIIGWLY